jgi:peptidoglycan biosynthesis protein MviN/MurJ (putative lipid II flippase)
LHNAARLLLAVSLPAAALIITGVRPLVGILGFDAQGSEVVVWTTRAFMLGLTGHALLEVAVRAFYARQDARTPLVAALLTLIAFVILAVLLVPWLGVTGIGLANSLAYSGEALPCWADCWGRPWCMECCNSRCRCLAWCRQWQPWQQALHWSFRSFGPNLSC